MDFIMVDAYSPYTAIIARPWLHVLGAISSTLHLKVKFSSGDQIKELVGSQFVARQCLLATIVHQPETRSPASTDRSLLQSRTPVSLVDEKAEGAKCEDLEKAVVGNDSEKFFQVGAQLPHQEKEELIEFLKRNIDVFAWSAYEAFRVDLSFIFHYLNVNPSVTPKKQPPRRSSKDYSDTVKDEVIKLKQVRSIKAGSGECV